MPDVAPSQQEVPVIETERLRLRGHRLDDFRGCCALWGDEEVTRYISSKPLTRDETWARLLRYAGHWSLLRYGFWVVEERETGRFVGEVGFADHKRGLDLPNGAPLLEGVPEIGWVIAPPAHGKGYATEAVHSALAWGDAVFRTPLTFCLIHPDNLPSIRVAAKCGYREWGRTSLNGHPATIYQRHPTTSPLQSGEEGRS